MLTAKLRVAAPNASVKGALALALLVWGFGLSVAIAAPTAPSPIAVDLPAAKMSGAESAKLDATIKEATAKHPLIGTTQAVIILQGGAITYESYGPSVDKTAKLNAWSISQSLNSLAVGRAVQLGLVKSIDEPAGIVDWKIAGDARQTITIKNLLQMNAGLAWSERRASNPGGSDAEKMYFGDGQRDVLAYAAAKKARSKPGEVFQYSSGAGVLLSSALQRRLPPLNAADGRRTFALQKLLSEDLLTKIGMTATAPQYDIAGNAYASSLTWTTARDLARFGQFCLGDGSLNKERLLPDNWLKMARTPSSAKGGASYGAGFWVKAAKPEETDTLMAELPADAFAAGGDRGAVVVMVPSKDVVVVRLGITPWGEKARAALGSWLGQVVNSIPDSQVKN